MDTELMTSIAYPDVITEALSNLQAWSHATDVDIAILSYKQSLWRSPREAMCAALRIREAVRALCPLRIAAPDAYNGYCRVRPKEDLHG